MVQIRCRLAVILIWRESLRTCCLEALAAAQARQDIYLEGAASQVFGLMTIEIEETE